MEDASVALSEERKAKLAVKHARRVERRRSRIGEPLEVNIVRWHYSY